MKIDSRAIAMAAVLCALCAVTGLLPYVFFLPVTVAITALSFPMAVFVGFAFGLISLLYSFFMPVSIVSAAIVTAPYIAILPRVTTAIIGYGAFVLIKILIKPKTKMAERITYALSGGVTSILNTITVVGLMCLVMPEFSFGGVTIAAYVSVMIIAGCIECCAMAVLTPTVTVLLNKTVLKNSRAFKQKRENALNAYENRTKLYAALNNENNTCVDKSVDYKKLKNKISE